MHEGIRICPMLGALQARTSGMDSSWSSYDAISRSAVLTSDHARICSIWSRSSAWLRGQSRNNQAGRAAVAGQQGQQKLWQRLCCEGRVKKGRWALMRTPLQGSRECSKQAE